MQVKESKNTEISERISKLVDALGVTPNAFAIALGYKRSQTVYDILNGKSAPSFDFFNKLAMSEYSAYLNMDWVITGRGEILLTKTPENVVKQIDHINDHAKDHKRKLQKTWSNTEYQKIEENMVPNASDVVLDHRFPLHSDHLVEEQRVPLYDLEASAGLESLFIDTHELIPSSYIVLPDLPPCDGALHVWGDSMYPLLKSGDIVLYRQVRNIADGILWGEMYLVSITVDDDEMVAVKYIQKGRDDAHVLLVSQNEFYSPKEVLLSSIRGLALIKASVRYNTMG